MGKLLIAIIVLLALMMLFLRNRKAAPNVKKGKSAKARKLQAKQVGSVPADSHTKPKPYQAVSIKTRLGACDAAIKMQDEVFLAADAPPLPLSSCDVDTCSCRYVYLDDRRQDDRRSPFGERTGVSGPSGERREGDDRRD